MQSIKMYLSHQQQALVSAYQQLLARPYATAMTILAIGVVLSLPVSLSLLIKNLRPALPTLHQAHITIYLHNNLTPHQRKSFLNRLSNNTSIPIEHTRYISPRQGLASFEKRYHFSGLAEFLPKNPLPPVMILNFHLPKSSNQLMAFKHTIASQPEVAEVALDYLWLQRLTAFLKMGTHLTYILIGLLSLGVILTVSNTTRLTVQGNRASIHILSLLGATPGYIRRPFLYTGMLMGLCSALMACLLTILITHFYWKADFLRIKMLYDVHAIWLSFDAETFFYALLTGSLLGGVGSWLGVVAENL